MLEKILSELLGLGGESLEVLKRIALYTKPRDPNIHRTYELDTSKTTLQTINIKQQMGVNGNTIEVISTGGGLYLGTSDETPIEVIPRDEFIDESFEIIRWKGSGTAGTAKIRVGGCI